MQLTELNAISPIDGRYRSKTISLSPFFSEEALIKYRVLIEVEYFIALCEADLPQLIIIDGGKGQLSAACEALKDLNLYGQIPIIGIAKRLEEIY